MKMQHLTLLSLLILALVACGPHTQPTPEDEAVTDTPAQPVLDDEAGPDTPAQPAPGESPLPKLETNSISPLPIPSLNPVAGAAVAYLAAELDVSPQEVTVLSFEAVQWSDASLGCPQPGMMYAQVITPGYRLLLQAKGKEYEIHTDQTGQVVVICQ